MFASTHTIGVIASIPWGGVCLGLVSRVRPKLFPCSTGCLPWSCTTRRQLMGIARSGSLHMVGFGAGVRTQTLL